MPVKNYEKKEDGTLSLRYTLVTDTDLENYVTIDTAQEITGAKTFSNTLTTQNIVPTATKTYELGSVDNFYKNAYVSTGVWFTHNADGSGKAIRCDGTNIIIDSGGSSRTSFSGGMISTNNDIIPYNTATATLGQDIGSSNMKWHDIYLAGSLSDGTNSISVANIQPKLTEGDGISIADDNTISLSAATSSVLGGVKLGSDTVQTTGMNTISTTSSRTYAVQKNSSDQLVVNVPWANTTDSVGASNSTSKLYLVGRTAQSTGTSYSNKNVYETNGSLYATTFYENNTALSSKYLALAGGTVTGDVTFNNNSYFNNIYATTSTWGDASASSLDVSTGTITANKFIKTNGTSSEFLKADGSTDVNEYQVKLVSGTNIKTVNGNSLLGYGNIEISGGSTSIPVASATTLGGIKTNFTDSHILSSNVVKPVYMGTASTAAYSDVTQYAFVDTSYAASHTDCSDATSSKLFLIGSTDMMTYGTTHSNKNFYVQNDTLTGTKISVNSISAGNDVGSLEFSNDIDSTSIATLAQDICIIGESTGGAQVIEEHIPRLKFKTFDDRSSSGINIQVAWEELTNLDSKAGESSCGIIHAKGLATIVAQAGFLDNENIPTTSLLQALCDDMITSNDITATGTINYLNTTYAMGDQSNYATIWGDALFNHRISFAGRSASVRFPVSYQLYAHDQIIHETCYDASSQEFRNFERTSRTAVVITQSENFATTGVIQFAFDLIFVDQVDVV